jgi:hypothetical protein
MKLFQAPSFHQLPVLMMKRCPECNYPRSWNVADERHKLRRCGTRYTLQSVWHASRLGERTKQQLLERFVLGVPVYRQRFRTPASLKAAERFYHLARLLRVCGIPARGRRRFSGKGTVKVRNGDGVTTLNQTGRTGAPMEKRYRRFDSVYRYPCRRA